MRGPELYQQLVEISPFFIHRIPNEASEGGRAYVDGDLSKVLGFYGLERRMDPPDPCRFASKHQVFKLCGLGEVEKIRRGCSCVDRKR